MNKHFLLLIALFLGITSLNANPVDREKAKIIGQKFACTAINSDLKASDLQLVYTGTSNRGEACFYAFNVGEEGFVSTRSSRHAQAATPFFSTILLRNGSVWPTPASSSLVMAVVASTSSAPPSGTKTHLITSMPLMLPVAPATVAMQVVWPRP